MIKKGNQPVVELDASGFNELRQTRNGWLIYNKYDIYIGASIKKYGEFSRAELDLFERVLQPGNLVVEVGANIGAHTVDLSRLVGNQGVVLAFEPQRLVFQTLCANLALNQCSNVFAYQQALGAEDGSVVVPVTDPRTNNNFGGISLLGATNGEPVSQYQLDALNLSACHFLKADVEGMEIAVIQGAVKTITNHRPFLYLENDRKEFSAQLIELVKSLRYDVYRHLPPLYNPDNFACDKENIFPGIVSGNLFCVPSELQMTIQGMLRIQNTDDFWSPPL